MFPGFFVLTTRSEKAGTREMNELSLAIRSPKGLAVIVGCSHPGVENILVAATQIDKQLYTAIGGFHLVLTPGEEIDRVASTRVGRWGRRRRQEAAAAHASILPIQIPRTLRFNPFSIVGLSTHHHRARGWACGFA
jgi:7,8-dihydropterin-6-yl-methyl-4-(beta-D-ribofuranosyl)aminobenzene 5'-phosphate synthase